jgi:transposase
MSITQSKVPIEIKRIIVSLKEEGKSYQEIANIVKRPRSTVQSVIRNYKKYNNFETAPGRGRKPILSAREKRKIEHYIKAEPRTSAPQIVASLKKDLNIDICPQTVRNFIHQKGYKSCVALKKPFLSKLPSDPHTLNFDSSTNITFCQNDSGLETYSLA